MKHVATNYETKSLARSNVTKKKKVSITLNWFIYFTCEIVSDTCIFQMQGPCRKEGV